MKIVSKIYILFVLLNAELAYSTQIKVKTSKESFFYSIPEESGNEWGYSIAECSKLADADRASTKKCEDFGDHKSCPSSKEVELVNPTNQKKKKFKLIFHVFTSLKKCADDRESALSGE